MRKNTSSAGARPPASLSPRARVALSIAAALSAPPVWAQTAAAPVPAALATAAEASADGASDSRLPGAAQANTATLADAATNAPADAGARAAPGALDAITVTSRKREEFVQDVPLPETVISGKQLEFQQAATLDDFANLAPDLGVSVTNSRQSSITVRGIGKNSANEAMQPSVGVIVDGVVLSQVGMTYANFVDLDRIELLRGPQGTLQGKNTTLGALVISTKQPSFTPQTDVEAGYGQRSTFEAKAATTGPLIDDLLAYRATIYDEQGNGPLVNQYAPLGGTWGGPNRMGGRLQFLLRPSDDLRARLILFYDASNERTNLSPYLLDPADFANGVSRTANGGTTYSSRLARPYFNGYVPFIGPVTQSQVDLNSAQPLPVHQRGVSAEVTQNLGEYTLTSITAYRYNDYNYLNDFDYTHFNIETYSGTIGNNVEYTEELRIASPTGRTVDYQAGVFLMRAASNSLSRTLYGNDAGAFYASNAQYTALAGNFGLLEQSLNGVYKTTEIDPYTNSYAAFAQANWHLTEKAVLTLGLRDTDETVGNVYNETDPATGAPITAASGTAAEVAAATQLRNTYLNQSDFGYRRGQPMRNNSIAWLVNPNYKLTDDVLLYASAARGVKSGAVQFDGTGNPANVAPETSLDFELGIKSAFLAHRLVLDLNLFETRVSQYQAQGTESVPLTVSTTGYLGILTNVGSVRTQGVELDGAWSPLRTLSFSLGGAYDNAYYSSYANATCPAEDATTKLCNFTGQQVYGAPHITGELGIDWHQPVGNGYLLHAFLDDAYRSRANLSSTLSLYGWQGGYTITNAGFGVSGKDGRYELDLIAKNLFDKTYVVNVSQYSNQAGVSVFWGDPLFVQLVFRARL